MKITVERDVLADALSWTAHALPARPISPVLAGIRMQAGSGLTLSAFDYEVSARATIAVPAADEGSALVSGRLLAEIVRSLPAKPVELATDDARLVVRCGSATFTLLLLPDSDYPTLPDMPPVAGSAGSDALATAAAQVAIAATKDDTLPALTCVQMVIAGNQLTMAATDRYRLAIRKLRWNPAHTDAATSVLIPARALLDITRAAAAAAEVSIFLATPAPGAPGLLAGFEAAGRRTTTQLIAADFPKYLSLLPAEFCGTAQIPTAPLTAAVKRVALVAPPNMAVRLTFSDGQAGLEAGEGGEAQATEYLDASYDDGLDRFQIAFNPQYLLDGLGAISSDTAKVSFTSPGKPAVITGADDAQKDYQYLLMPIRTAE